jgi:hypothetical protein
MGNVGSMLSFAPRYPPVLLVLILGLDDETQPIAETCRRVGVAAERLGIVRPSYPQVRRIVLAERRRRRETGVQAGEALSRLLSEVVPAPARLGDLSWPQRRASPQPLWLRATKCLRRRMKRCRLRR